MAGGGKGRALAKKAIAEEEKEKAARVAAEANEAAHWAVGAKDNKKSSAKAEAEAERLKKQAEKKMLEAMDDMDNSNIKTKPVKSKKSKVDDLAMLQLSLSMVPKTKAQRDAEAKQKAAEEKKKAKAEAQQRAKDEAQEREEANRRRLAAKGIVDQSSDLLAHQKEQNKQLDTEDEVDATGIDSAIQGIFVSLNKGKETQDAHPEKRMKALYNAYFEAQLPIWKEDHPGLKLSQYKERIFDAWQNSPENPRNLKT